MMRSVLELYGTWATENEALAGAIMSGLHQFQSDYRGIQVERARVLLEEARAFRVRAAELMRDYRICSIKEH